MKKQVESLTRVVGAAAAVVRHFDRELRDPVAPLQVLPQNDVARGRVELEWTGPRLALSS